MIFAEEQESSLQKNTKEKYCKVNGLATVSQIDLYEVIYIKLVFFLSKERQPYFSLTYAIREYKAEGCKFPI